MKQYIVALICCYSVFSPLHQVLSLKCRTGNQQSDDQFQKIMQVCRRRFLGYERENGARDYNGRDSDSQESSDSESDEDVFDNKFLSSGSGSNNNRYNNGKNNNNNNKNSGRYDYSRNMTHQSSQSRSGGNRSSGSRWSSDNGQMGNNNRQGMIRNGGRIDNSRGYSDNRFNNNNNNNNNNRAGNNYNNNNNNGNNDDNSEGSEHEQACVIQCFFNELNLVDQRGFPEKSAVVGIMTQNIQDPELRDFVEESVIECYHYLNNNGRQEKCQFSQNLLSCLADKGSERCEDWDDD